MWRRRRRRRREKRMFCEKKERMRTARTIEYGG
jgi:hypothetical protein